MLKSMMHAGSKAIFFFACAAAALVTLSGCSPSTQQVPSAALVKPSLTSDAAKDFLPLSVNEVVLYPIVGVAGERAGQLDQSLTQALQAYTGLKLINIEDSTRVSQALRALPAVVPFERARELGIAVGAQGVVFTEVNRFVESDGGKYGATNSAAVNFRVRLIEPRTGRTLWQASFDQQDEPLTQNLFRLPEVMKQGVKFRSSLEMIQGGFADTARALQKLRDGQ